MVWIQTALALVYIKNKWEQQYASASNANACSVRALLKSAVFELKSKYPVIKFLIYALSVPVSKTVSESWEPVKRRVMLKRPTANNGKTVEVGTTDMRVFMLSWMVHHECKNTRKF